MEIWLSMDECLSTSRTWSKRQPEWLVELQITLPATMTLLSCKQDWSFVNVSSLLPHHASEICCQFKLKLLQTLAIKLKHIQTYSGQLTGNNTINDSKWSLHNRSFINVMGRRSICTWQQRHYIITVTNTITGNSYNDISEMRKYQLLSFWWKHTKMTII